MIREGRTRRGAEEGSVAVEAAVTLAAVLFLLLGVVQFGLAFFAWNTMLLAAEEAGRYAMLYNPVNYPRCPPGCAATLANCARTWANQNCGDAFPVTASADANCHAGAG